MKSSVNKLTLFFFALMIVGGFVVATYTGEKRHEVKLAIQSYENLDSLIHSVGGSVELQAPIQFLGVDPEMPESTEFVQKWIAEQAAKNQPFQAVIVDEALTPLIHLEKSEILQEGFDFHKNPERLFGGIKTAAEKNIKLLVVVMNADAIKERADGLLAQSIATSPNINSLIVSKFPRVRDEEKALSLPCNTGEEDRALVATLGCYVLQKSRLWYSRKWASNTWLSELVKLKSGEDLLMMSLER